ncbi:MAG: HAD hydrolase family protein [bacterium]|nr:HAD hydrolase family protein [bacterium]
MKVKFAKVKLLLLDVDGVLTDGMIYMGSEGEILKVFNARDGLAIKIALKSGLEVGLLSGRYSKITENRATELGIERVYLGYKNKLAVLEKLIKEENIDPETIAFCGDDIIDIPALRKVGVPITVANAAEEVKHIADYISGRAGGDGAVYEIVKQILTAKKMWDDAVENFIKDVNE